METAQEAPSKPAAIPFPPWKFCADQDNSIAHDNQWLQPSFLDHHWRNIGNEAWNLKFDNLKDYSGFGPQSGI
jgi:hypothetical protein